MKTYYAASSYMGTDFTYDSPCWSFFSFDSKDFRDRWVKAHEYNDQGNRVTEAVSAKTAKRYGGEYIESISERVTCHECSQYVGVIHAKYFMGLGPYHAACVDAIIARMERVEQEEYERDMATLAEKDGC